MCFLMMLKSRKRKKNSENRVIFSKEVLGDSLKMLSHLLFFLQKWPEKGI